MNTQEDGKKYKRRRFYLVLGGTMAVFWLLTIFWGTKQVHRDIVQLFGIDLPESFTIFEDRQSLDKSVDWILITEPWAPLPFIVSIDVDVMDDEYHFFHRRRFYFFWFLGYTPEHPFFGRDLPETYEE